MIELELWQLIGLIAMLPLAFIGIFILFKKLIETIMIRSGNVKMIFFTPNRGIKTTLGKPNSDYIPLGGNKMYMFSPKNIYRWGHTPTVLYNEDSTDPLDPLDREKSKLSTGRLSELLIRWYNLGAISTMKKERLIQILLIIAVIAIIASAGVQFVSWQSINTIGGTISAQTEGLKGWMSNEILKMLPQKSNITVLE